MADNRFGTTGNPERIQRVLAEIERRKSSRRDYIYPASKLAIGVDGKLSFAATDTFQVGDRVYTEWKDAEAAADASGQELKPLGKAGALMLSRTAENQLASRLGIPIKYVDALRSEKESADLAAQNFNTLLERCKKRFLVRTLDGNVRAVLSDQYKIIDNCDVFFAAAEVFGAVNADIWNARLWDNGFEMFAASKTLTAEVQRSEAFQKNMPHGWWKGNDGNIPDTHFAGCRIRNSETGLGGLTVEPVIIRQVCRNTAIVGERVTTVHLGRRAEEDGLVYAEDTQQAESKATWLKLRDTIKQTFDADKFKAYMDRLNGLTSQAIDKPEEVVKAVAAEFQLSEDRRAAILRSLFQNRDLTRFGLVQAVTEQAHEAGEEEASRLEEVGGELIRMADGKFAAMSA